MTQSQDDIWAEAYRRNILPPEKKAVYEEAMRRGLVQGAQPRSPGQRFLDNVSDTYQSSWVNAGWRAGAQAAGHGEAPSAGLLPGNPIEGVAGTVAAVRRIFDRQGAERYGDRVVAEEQIRRERFAEISARDPFYRAPGGAVGQAAAGAATLGGVLAGSAADPLSWVSPGKSVLQRSVAQGALAFAADTGAQGSDVETGLLEQYSLARGALSAAAGSAFSAGLDGLGHAVRPVADIVRRAFTDPITTKVAAPAPAAHPGTPGGGNTATSSAALTAAATPAAAPVAALPEFSIVRRVERKTPMMDALTRAREGELPQMVGEGMARAYTAIVSDNHPLTMAVESIRSDTEKLAGRAIDLLPSEDPRMLVRGRFDWSAIGHQDLLHGVHEYRGTTPTTPALADVVTAVAVRAKRAGEKAEDAVQRLNEYMVARRSIIEWDRHARGELDAEPVSKTKAEAEAFVARIDSEDPEFRAASEQVNEFAGGLLKKAFDSGLVSKTVYDASIAARDFYVPLRRVMDDGPKTGGSNAGGNAGSAVKKFKGSERDVVDPISVLIERAYRLNRAVRQNDLNLSFVRMAERLTAAQERAGVTDPSNRWLRKIDTPNKKVGVSKEELAAQAKAGVDIDKAFDDDVEIWRPGEIHTNGKPVLFVWRDGKREAWEVIDPDWGREVFESLSGMSKGMQDTFLDVVGVPTMILAQTITRDPAFLMSNFIRDQVSSWILTDVGFKPGEGALGIADELAQSDVTRLYGLTGGISGGAATAMLGDALHKADTMALSKKGIKAKYFSSLGGLLSVSEISETGTRLRVFKRAVERAKKAGFSEYDALIQASFTARDLIDFGRAGSKMHYTRRLVTFLNAQVQGLDKSLRVLSADGALTRASLKDAIAPLFNQTPGAMVRAEDAAALKLATKAWTKVAAISTIGLTIAAMFHDDPEYQQANERMRATHWTIPWGDNLVRIPKPFELAFLSNIVERGFEATVGQDERAVERMWTGLWELLKPPTDIPGAAVIGGLASNTNAMTNRPIVPEYMQDQPPELQYQHWNSQFSRWLGAQIGYSPAKIDYAITGFAGPIGSYALAAMDAADPDRPSGSWTDLPVVRRFVQPWTRGAQDKRDFYDRSGARSSELMRAKNGIDTYTERGQTAEANAILADLDEPGRVFVLSQMGSSAVRRLHPLDRARVFAQEASGLIGELNGAMPKDGGAPLPPLRRSLRQNVEEAVERITVSEMHNAMVVTGQPGFQNRKEMDRNGYWEDLKDLAPEVAAELERRLGSGRNRVYDYDAVMAGWPELEARLKAEGSTAYLDDLAADAQGRTQSWGESHDGEDEVEPVFRF